MAVISVESHNKSSENDSNARMEQGLKGTKMYSFGRSKEESGKACLEILDKHPKNPGKGNHVELELKSLYFQKRLQPLNLLHFSKPFFKPHFGRSMAMSNA